MTGRWQAMEAQPYKRGVRAPSPVLDAMKAGMASPAPGAAIMAATEAANQRNSAMHPSQHPVLKGRKRRSILVPRL